jgi:hypothetical protein
MGRRWTLLAGLLHATIQLSAKPAMRLHVGQASLALCQQFAQ